MKIAQIAPLFEAVPPKLYGGTERVVHYLTEALIEQGHEVTLFASGDSVTKGRLISNVKEALRLNKNCVDPLAHQIVQMEEVVERAGEFDILHFHIDFLHYPFTSCLQTPCITTLHGRLDIPDLQSVYNKFPHQHVISISDNQRKPLPQANWAGTVYHGLPLELLKMGIGKGNYLAFIGRISPEKGVEKAIEIAVRSNHKLFIAAKVDKVDQHYFEREIKPLLDHPLIEFIGEINEEQKKAFLGDAKALLFPINWEEPFGIVMIEAMACGTPVIAFNRGSVPEVIEEKVSGFIVNNTEEAIEAVSEIHKLSREKIRNAFEQRFTAARMAKDYVSIYQSLVDKMNDAKANIRSIKNFIPYKGAGEAKVV